jgi:catechol 2,3-dioxygenase-like lactoylglutathione lyase family enzyme
MGYLAVGAQSRYLLIAAAPIRRKSMLRSKKSFVSVRSLAAVLCLALSLPVLAQQRVDRAETVAPLIYLPAMFVFRRSDVEQERMLEFYGDVLGFEKLPNIGAVGRIKVGATEFKMPPRSMKGFQRPGIDDAYPKGGVKDATGFRLASFFFADEAALVARFKERGLPVPEFKSWPGSANRVALTTDPDGQAVQLTIVPDGPAATYGQFEIGLTVSNIEKSRAFYRDFMGLEELAPVEDPLFGTTKYSFRNGSTIVSLRSFGPGLPADKTSGIIQILVTNVERVQELAKERGITIDRPLTAPPDARLRVVWLDDPDGVTQYMTETAESRAAAAPAAR